MMDHTEILPRLVAFHDDALPDHERAVLTRHLDLCADCRARLEDWAALDSSLQELVTPEPAVADMGSAVLRRIESGHVTKLAEVSLRRPAPGPWKVWVGAAAAVLVLAVSAALWRSDTNENGEAPGLAQAPSRASEESRESAELGRGPAGPTNGKDERLADAIPRTEQVPESNLAASPRSEGGPPASGRIAANVGEQRVRAEVTAAAPRSIRSEDSGIPQGLDWPARLADYAPIRYRFYDRIDAAYVELNVVPLFEVAFAPVSYARRDPLSDRWDAANPEPTLLSPEDTYLVSNLRVERATLLALVTNQAPTSEVRYRLAEVTWRLANITADQDDVRSAISAQSEVMRQNPEAGTQSRARLAYLRGLVR